MDIKQLKAELKKKTDANPEKYYAVQTLKEKGFHRSKCSKCGKYFWTSVKSEICGDANCVGKYTFIGDSPTRKKLDFIQVWEEFSKTFKKLGYVPIKRYPTVARWRDDVYWTNASIYDFQPHVVSGEAEPPANPLVVPQPCIRFNDIDNVGITGSHYTSFVMIGQHGFFRKEKFDVNKYLADIFTWLEKGVQIPLNELKFHEDQWGGGGNLGVCMEFFARGLELGNQVYITYEITPTSYKELNLKTLDMGTGQERYSWITSGTNTSYEANFPTVVKSLYEQTGIKPNQDLVKRFLPYSGLLNFEESLDIEKTWKQISDKLGISTKELKREILKLGALYSIADHTRTVLFAISDGSLPSNLGGQYNLRVLYRRVVDFINTYGWAIGLEGIIEKHAKYLKPQYPELEENLDSIYKILRVEREKYRQTIGKSGRIIQQLLEKKEKITGEKLAELYDSQGIAPELLRDEAKKVGIELKIPENFYSRVAERHPEVLAKKETAAKEINISGVGETVPLYYKNAKLFKAKGKILKIIGNNVILDQTIFYPTAGGQQNDTGNLGKTKVFDVQKSRGVILHRVDNPNVFRKGQTVNLEIDSERRLNLARNHDAAHILGGAARKILGKHIWQAGSQIDADKGRLDITHYENLTDVQKYEIEKLANKIIKEKRKIIKKDTPRNEAEKKYGFTLYQGGAVPGKTIRVVEIKDFDAQACGGIHLDNTKESEGIQLIKTEKIQDGVIRLVFVAGKGLIAKKELREKELAKDSLLVLEKYGVKVEKANLHDLEQAAKVFSVKIQDLPKTLERFFSEIKDNSERMDDLEKILNRKPGEYEKPLIESLSRTKDFPVIAKIAFEHWKGQKKKIKILEEQLVKKYAEDLTAGAKTSGNAKIIIGSLGDFALAVQTAAAVLQKNESALVIISTPERTLCASGKNLSADCRETLNTLIPNSEIRGSRKLAHSNRKLGIGEEEAESRLADMLK